MTQRKDPWDDPAKTAPRIRINLVKQGSGKWVSERTAEFPAIDPVDQAGTAMILDTLEALDKLIREHVTELYQKDSDELEDYFRKREEGNFNYRRAS